MLPSQLKQQQPSPPGGSPLSAGFPPLSTRTGMTPTLGFDADDFGSVVGVVGVGAGLGDFASAFSASSAHGSPLALA